MSVASDTTLDRDQLIGLADQYVEALVSRDPARLAVTRSVRFTENGQRLALGKGLWATATGRERGGHYFVDEVGGQIEHWGLVEEVGNPAILSLRLKVDAGPKPRIREVETFVVRQTSPVFSPATVIAPRPAYLEQVAPAERHSREELVRIADLYFEGIEQDNGDLIPVADDVGRIENGIQTTRNPDSEREVGRMGVREQIDQGFTKHIEAARDRRWLVVDPERGLALCHFFFDHPGGIETVGGRIPFGYPNSMMATEVFKVRAGLIRNIEALIDVFPYGMPSGW
jgi:hypothetical protein